MAQKGYTDEQREQALRALVLANGNVKLAQERMSGAGLPHVPERTFRDWKNEHAERIEELQDQRPIWVAAGLAEQAEFMAATLGEAELRMVNVINSMPEEKLREMSPNVLAMALKSITTAKAINTDKSQLLRGQPTTITRSESSVADLIATLHKKFPELQAPGAIEGHAQEIEGED